MLLSINVLKRNKIGIYCRDLIKEIPKNLKTRTDDDWSSSGVFFIYLFESRLFFHRFSMRWWTAGRGTSFNWVGPLYDIATGHAPITCSSSWAYICKYLFNLFNQYLWFVGNNGIIYVFWRVPPSWNTFKQPRKAKTETLLIPFLSPISIV